jgi:hypothetical protein
VRSWNIITQDDIDRIKAGPELSEIMDRRDILVDWNELVKVLRE